MNPINNMMVSHKIYEFLFRNKMIKETGEFKPTVKDIIEFKKSSYIKQFKVKYRTEEAIKKLTY